MSKFADIEVSIIGTGRVAKSLAQAFDSNQVKINEVYGRSFISAQRFCKTLSTGQPTDSLDFSSSTSHIFIIAVSDDVIVDIVDKLMLPKDAYLCHTSGTVSLETLAGSCPSYGIFYPLQTFTTDHLVDFQEVPILLEASTQQTLDVLRKLGQRLTGHLYEANEFERQRLHLAAVFASNFTNRMLAVAEEILEDGPFNLDVLRPLVMESMINVFERGADQALTGPAKRGDQQTISKHLGQLADKPEFLAIYDLLTKQITSKF